MLVPRNPALHRARHEVPAWRNGAADLRVNLSQGRICLLEARMTLAGHFVRQHPLRHQSSVLSDLGAMPSLPFSSLSDSDSDSE